MLAFAYVKIRIKNDKDSAKRKEILAAESKKRFLEISQLRDTLGLDPNATSDFETLFHFANSNPEYANQIYEYFLEAVTRSKASSTAKRFALEAGRLAYGHSRPDGRPTTYDEQAIQNDIAARF